jgi:hypothetical protein
MRLGGKVTKVPSIEAVLGVGYAMKLLTTEAVREVDPQQPLMLVERPRLVTSGRSERKPAVSPVIDNPAADLVRCISIHAREESEQPDTSCDRSAAPPKGSLADDQRA